jgi:hypothetical protein
MAFKHVMVDLETMDSKCTAAITAIGAVAFDLSSGTLETNEFYVKVDLQSSMDAECTVSGDTINWWLVQNEAARKEMAKKGVPLIDALVEFENWLADAKNTKVWGNGASFDNAILAHAYAKVRIELPWKFWNDRCYRTVKGLNPNVPLVASGVAHNALDDARQQALHLIEISKGGKVNG